MFKQRTIKRVVHACGTGLHTGKEVNITFHPHHPDGGIVFRRVDLDPPVDIPAKAEFIRDANMCSNLVQDHVSVGTVEHLMSTIAGLGIDNLLIEVEGVELPMMDGSASHFLYLLFKECELVEQDAPKKFIKIKKTVVATIDDKIAKFEPFDGFWMDFTIDFNHPKVKQYPSISLEFSSANFFEKISFARTFGFLDQLEALHKNDLALGATLDNAIGLTEDDVANEGGLRCEDELVRHKVLDAIGDLYLLQHQILAKFTAYKSGHALNNQLLRAVMADPANYEIVTFHDKEECPIKYVPVV